MAQSKEDIQAVVDVLAKVNQQLVLMTKNADKASEELVNPKTLKDLEKIEKSIELNSIAFLENQI